MNAIAPSIPLCSLKVLLVDDDSFMLDLVADLLDQMGITSVTAAHDGQRGATLGCALRPDLLICDIDMPGKDGFQVLESLAEGRFKGAVLMLSGMEARVLNSAALMGRFHHLNLLGVLAKPPTRASLSSALARLIS
jgi:CheY-like chemotaxis protein